MFNIAIFASGTGSNARRIMEHFRNSDIARVALVVSNKKDAGVLDIAAEFGVETRIIGRQEFYETQNLLNELKSRDTGLIVLAGFLWKIPDYLVWTYAESIVNIHPALLPKYGGKGMYGIHVHEAVKAAGDTESGITIHYVNEHYDEGAVIFQAKCPVSPDDSAADIARNVLKLEHLHFPIVVEQLIRKKLEA